VRGRDPAGDGGAQRGGARASPDAIPHRHQSRDVIHDATRIYGDGINVAARLEGLAEPGGVLVSQAVHDQVRDRLDLAFEELGERELKNIARPVRVNRLRPPAESTTPPVPEAALPLPDRPSIAVLPFANMSLGGHFKCGHRWTAQNRPKRQALKPG
jgi:hypothetical protein